MGGKFGGRGWFWVLLGEFRDAIARVRSWDVDRGIRS